MDWLLNLFHIYMDWRTSVPEDSMHFGIAWAPIVASVAAPLVADALFGGPSSAEKRALGSQSALADEQLRALQERLGIGRQMQKRANNFESVLPALLSATGGTGFRLPGNPAGPGNLSDILAVLAKAGPGGVSPVDDKGMVEALLQAAGVFSGAGTGGVLQGAQHAQQNAAARDASFGNLASSISQSLLADQQMDRLLESLTAQTAPASGPLIPDEEWVALQFGGYGQ